MSGVATTLVKVADLQPGMVFKNADGGHPRWVDIDTAGEVIPFDSGGNVVRDIVGSYVFGKDTDRQFPMRLYSRTYEVMTSTLTRSPGEE